METGDEEDENLGPMSYKWTLELLADDKTRARTRYELFKARKDYEDAVRTRRMLLIQMRQLENQRKQREEVLNIIQNYRIMKEKQERIENLLRSKRVTRSMISKLENSKIELKAILRKIPSKVILCKKLASLERIENDFEGVKQLNDRINAHNELTDSLLNALER